MGEVNLGLDLVAVGTAGPGRPARSSAPELAARRRARTLSASWSSRELEWLFFSVTPTSGSTSRIDLLLTSSSLARSLIRILLIRPFVLRTVPLSLHINLTASVFRFAQPLAVCAKEPHLLLLLGKEQAPPRIQLFLLGSSRFSSTAARRVADASAASGALARFHFGGDRLRLAAASSAAGSAATSPSTGDCPASPPSRLEK